jgi:hypothetical protein
MKKQITLTILSLITLAGGSWLAAQQREALRTTSPNSSRYEDLLPGALPAASAGPIDLADPERQAAQPPIRRATASARTMNPAARALPANVKAEGGPPDYYTQQVFGVQASMPGQFGMPGVTYPQPTRMTPEDAARMRAFQEAIRALRSAESDEDKTAAREEVTELVSEQLDSDLANREEELDAIERRAKELRKQLDERKSAKPEMLKMLVMLIDNPQVGLGIPQEWMQMLMRGQPSGNQQPNYGGLYPGVPQMQSVIGIPATQTFAPTGNSPLYSPGSAVAPAAPARPRTPEAPESDEAARP